MIHLVLTALQKPAPFVKITRWTEQRVLPPMVPADDDDIDLDDVFG